MPRFLTLLLVISPQTRSCTDNHGWRLSSGFLRWCSSYCLNRTHYVTYPLITLKLGWCEIVYLWFVSYLSVLYWWFDEWWCGSSLCSWDKTRLKKKTSTPHTYTLVLVFHSKHTTTQKLGLTIHDIGHASILNTRKHIHILLKQIYTLMWCLIIRIFVSVCCVVYFQQDRTDTEKKRKKRTYPTQRYSKELKTVSTMTECRTFVSHQLSIRRESWYRTEMFSVVEVDV